MAEAKAKPQQKMSNSKIKETKRGTTDLMELISLVVQEDAMLLRKVRDKIRIIRDASKETAMDVAKKKYDQKKANTQKKDSNE